MDEIVRDGRALRYVQAGDGPGLVLVHGWCGDHTAFAPQLEHFAATHRVVALDLRGHGESDAGGPYTIDAFADDVAWLTRALGLRAPVVIGHSMGAMIAVEAAATHPDLFVAAVSLDGPVVADPMLAQGVAMQLAIFDGPERESQGPAFLRAALWGPHDDHDRATTIIESMMRVPKDVALPSLAEVIAWPERRRLLDCDQPVLCLHVNGGGPTDPTALAAGRTNVVVGQTVGAGHFIQLEVPDQVHAMIERFLAITAVQGP